MSIHWVRLQRNNIYRIVVAFACVCVCRRMVLFIYFRFLFVCWSFNRVKRKCFLCSDHFTPFKISNIKLSWEMWQKKEKKYESMVFVKGPPLQISMWKEILLLIEHLSNIYCWWLFCVFFGFWRWCERRIVFYLVVSLSLSVSCTFFVWILCGKKGFCDYF